MDKQIIDTRNAPSAIGAYSQAVKVGNTVYLSGQVPLDPKTMTMVSGTIEEEIHQVFRNLAAVAAAGGATLKQAVKMTIYLTDLAHFGKLNEIMPQYVDKPYPARVTVGVASLPKGARVEVDAILVVD